MPGGINACIGVHEKSVVGVGVGRVSAHVPYRRQFDVPGYLDATGFLVADVTDGIDGLLRQDIFAIDAVDREGAVCAAVGRSRFDSDLTLP